jgi:hypothetical protein
MDRNGIVAVAIMLCTLVVGTIFLRERCRLGDVHWQACTWTGIPHVGGPLPTP